MSVVAPHETQFNTDLKYKHLCGSVCNAIDAWLVQNDIRFCTFSFGVCDTKHAA